MYLNCRVFFAFINKKTSPYGVSINLWSLSRLRPACALYGFLCLLDNYVSGDEFPSLKFYQPKMEDIFRHALFAGLPASGGLIGVQTPPPFVRQQNFRPFSSIFCYSTAVRTLKADDSSLKPIGRWLRCRQYCFRLPTANCKNLKIGVIIFS